MAVKVPWKSLSKPSAYSKWFAFSSRRNVFFIVAGSILAVGLLVRSGLFFGEPEMERKAPVTETAPAPPTAAPAPPTATAPAPPPATPAVEPAESLPKPQPPAQETAPAQEAATAPNQPVEQPGEASEQSGAAVERAEQSELPDSGTILVSRHPVEVLSGPSTSASVMYGFPADRPFRVIGREGSFVQIKDLESSASGWIDEAALAPPRRPAVSAPSRSRPDAGTRTPATVAAEPKPKATRRDSSETAAEPPVQARKRPGLFGGDGPFRGIFGN